LLLPSLVLLIGSSVSAQVRLLTPRPRMPHRTITCAALNTHTSAQHVDSCPARRPTTCECNPRRTLRPREFVRLFQCPLLPKFQEWLSGMAIHSSCRAARDTSVALPLRTAVRTRVAPRRRLNLREFVRAARLQGRTLMLSRSRTVCLPPRCVVRPHRLATAQMYSAVCLEIS